MSLGGIDETTTESQPTTYQPSAESNEFLERQGSNSDRRKSM